MAHTSLYRKYRPETFDDVVGQNHIERTLRNAVAEGTVAHAYLFTGPRGTGKTTTARLLAKALLCEKGPTGEPDATCEQCIEVAEGRHPDVIELDAASHTQVEIVRDQIISKVQFAPTRGKYKIYIIDEVHMLSPSSFNALLKTLEEPPAHVVFVLATTHPHKVPETIHSRCQRFDFHRIGVDDLVSRLRFIADAEKFEVSDAALTLIGRHASGGMRDAITTLEQLAAFTGGKIGLEDVEGLIGEVDSSLLFEVGGLIARRDIAGCFRWVARFVETGTDLAEFVRALTAHVRDLYVIAAVGDALGIVDRTAEEQSQLQSQAVEFGGPDRLARVMDLLGELGAEMRWSSDPRLSLEVALTRMARPQGEMTLEALAERVEVLERTGVSAPPAASPAASGARGVATGSAGDDAPRRDAFGDAAGGATAAEPVATFGGSAQEASAPVVASTAASAPAAAAEPAPEPVLGGAKLDRAAAKRNWQAVIVEIRKMKPARVQTFSNVEVDVDADGQTLVIEFPADQEFSKQLAEEPDMRELLKRALAAAFGTVPAFRFQLGRGVVRPVDAPAPVPQPVAAPAAVEPPAYEDGPNYDDYAPSGPDDDPYAAAAVPAAAPAPAPAPAAATAPSPVAATATGDDLTNLLVHGLGAQIVSEHPAEPEGEDE